MSVKKLILLALTVSLIIASLSAAASAASKKSSSSPAPIASESVGIVDRGLILDNHPGLNQARQQ